jgi:hypothetical protein
MTNSLKSTAKWLFLISFMVLGMAILLGLAGISPAIVILLIMAWLALMLAGAIMGFAGGVKRHHFHGGPRTHGQSDRQRSPGSIAPTTSPGKIHKGKRMAGHMGDERVTTQNLKVVLVDAERNLVAVRGSVPGAAGSLVMVKQARKG